MSLTSPRIPKLPFWLLKKMCIFDSREGYAGDIEEEFAEKSVREGKRRAIRWLWIHTIIAVPGACTSYLLWGGTMFKNYTKSSIIFTSQRWIFLRSSLLP